MVPLGILELVCVIIYLIPQTAVIGAILLTGYLGGTVDNVIQRLIEALIAVPTLPLWMGLSVALPANWPVTRTYFWVR